MVMPEMKRCKQCGVLKGVDAFRQYTYSKNKGTEGRFRICRQCESMNTTYKRLLAEKEKFWDEERGQYSYAVDRSNYWQKLTSDINKIEGLYKLLEAHGYSVPTAPKQHGSATVSTKVDNYVEQLSSFYGVRNSESEESPRPIAPALEPEEMSIPDDLRRWLELNDEDFVEMGLTPDYLQETVYEALKAKYRPQTGTDPQTFLPVYDDTYKNVLNQILRRFDDYEDYYATQEGDNENGTETES